MLQILAAWYERYFTDYQAVVLLLVLVVGAILILVFGRLLAPFIASIVIAYVLEWVVGLLVAAKMPRILAFYVVYGIFLGLLLLTVFVVLPALWEQTTSLLSQVPEFIYQGRDLLYFLPEQYPEYIRTDQIDSFVVYLREQSTILGRQLLAMSLASITGVIVIFVYLILVPLMVFFIMKDRELLVKSIGRYLPENRGLLRDVWGRVHQQLGCFVRGKVAETLIVMTASFILFSFFGMQYALLLAFLVGISVWVPYVGAVAVTVPVALVGFFQLGLSSSFLYMIIGYLIIQILDGNVLVPLLFAEATNLHPLSIIVAILFFGGIWGLWGVFFAIPLAILIKAVIESWPVKNKVNTADEQLLNKK